MVLLESEALHIAERMRSCRREGHQFARKNQSGSCAYCSGDTEILKGDGRNTVTGRKLLKPEGV